MEPQRWPSPDDARAALNLKAVADRLRSHRTDLVAAQRRLYEDVVFRTQEGPLESRLPGHYRDLESVQRSLTDWYEGPRKNAPLAFKKGDEIRATMLGTDEFFDAVVDVAHLDGTLDVVFFDGELERNVTPDRVQKRRKQRAPVVATGGFAATKKKAKRKR